MFTVMITAVAYFFGSGHVLSVSQGAETSLLKVKVVDLCPGVTACLLESPPCS